MRRVPAVDGLRGIAAVVVVLVHLWECIAAAGTFEPWPSRLAALQFGWLGVPVFIVVSGFCLGLPLADGRRFDLRDFARRRVRRIGPPYYAALLLATGLAVAIPLVAGHHVPAAFLLRRLAVYAVFLEDTVYDPVGDIDLPMWTVALEAQIYVLFALVLVPLWRRAGSTAVALFAALVSALLTYLVPSFPNAWLVLAFAIGVVAADRCGRARVGIAWVTGVAAVFSLVFSSDHVMLPETLVAVTVGFFLAAPPGRVAALLALPPFAYLGKISYSLYLVHFPLLLLFKTLVVRAGLQGDAVVVFALAVPAVVVAADRFYRIAERPFQRAPLASRRPPDPGPLPPAAGDAVLPA